MRCAGGLVAFARCRRHHAFDGGILRVGFLGKTKGFIEPKALRLNVHTFDSRHRADRRVEGWLRRDGQMVGFKEWADGWVCKS